MDQSHGIMMKRFCLYMLSIVMPGGIDARGYVYRIASRAGYICRVFVFAILLFSGVSEGQTEQTRHILILNSYHKGFAWTDDQTSAIKEVLSSSIDNLELYIEYMDTKRIYTPEYLEHLLDVFHLKYDKVKLDALIATDDNALQFAMKYHEKVFGGVPVSFCGINDYYPGMLDGKDAFTGLIEVLDIKPTIDLAMKLHTPIRTVYVITDNTPTGIGQQRDVKAVSKQYKDVEFKYLSGEDYSHIELLARLRTLPENGLVLLTVWLRDKTNAYISVEEGGPAISSASTVPVYGIITMYQNHGIVGGKLLSSREQGRNAAKLMLRVLAGEKPTDIGVITESVNPYIFDFTELRRWHIGMARLPKGSLIFNEPKSFYYRHRKLVWGVVAIVILESALIAYLFMTMGLRKRAEQALRQSEELARASFNATSEMVYLIDTECNVLTVNDVAAQRLGKTPKELIGTNILSYFPPDIAKSRKQYADKTTCTGKPVHYQDEREGHFSNISIYPTFNLQGKVDRLAVFVADITERRQAEEALRQSENKYRNFIANSTDGIYRVDFKNPVPIDLPHDELVSRIEQNAIVGEINVALADMYGMKSEEMIGRPLTDFAPDYGLRGAMLLGNEGYQYAAMEAIDYDKDGNKMYLSESGIGEIEDGRLIHIRGVQRNITERKQNEETLRLSEERLNMAMSVNNDGIYDWDITTNKVFFDHRYYTMAGYEPNEFDGTYDDWAKRVHPDDLAGAEQAIKAYLAGKVAKYDEEFRFRRKEGQWMWIRARTKVMERNENGAPLRMVGTHTDITERKQAEDKLKLNHQQLVASEQQLRANGEELQKLLKVLTAKNAELQSIVYIASHDLRSPLVNVTGFGDELAKDCNKLKELLQDVALDEDKAKIANSIINDSIPESLYYINTSTKKMYMLLEGMLQVSRIGTAEVNIALLDMNKILSHVIETAQFKAKEGGATITASQLPGCFGDGIMINQIFSNLIDNALKYLDASRKGKIHISCQTDGRMNIYCVADNGIGIDPDHQNKIFEVFHRLEPEDSAGGEGLGLTIVTRTLDRLNGEISVESESGKGSRFFISLPAANV